MTNDIISIAYTTESGDDYHIVYESFDALVEDLTNDNEFMGYVSGFSIQKLNSTAEEMDAYKSKLWDMVYEAGKGMHGDGDEEE